MSQYRHQKHKPDRQHLHIKGLVGVSPALVLGNAFLWGKLTLSTPSPLQDSSGEYEEEDLLAEKLKMNWPQ